MDYVKNDAINVYVPYGTGFGGVARFLGSNQTIVRLGSLNRTNFLHEIGHNLDLAHTRTFNGLEHTTREEFLPDGITRNPDFNADQVGDEVVDTAAQGGFWFPGTITYPNIDENSCTYVGMERDELGVLYDISHLDVINVMADAYTCTERHITIGQAIHMHEFVRNSNRYQPIIQSPEVLFEPYSGAYATSYPSGAPQGPLFQPGFDYKFIQCFGNYPTPSYYNEVFGHNQINVRPPISANETNYASIYKPNNSAMVIEQLTGYPFTIYEAQKCYEPNNFAIGGKSTCFNDGVFNGNVTITPMDSTAINNPQMIEQMDPGLYVIKKNYEDGSAEENVILKEGNE